MQLKAACTAIEMTAGVGPLASSYQWDDIACSVSIYDGIVAQQRDRRA
ncbi:hypothetical protein ACVIGB_008956 [Bradyrhizobium sp. USDA 4341]